MRGSKAIASMMMILLSRLSSASSFTITRGGGRFATTFATRKRNEVSSWQPSPWYRSHEGWLRWGRSGSSIRALSAKPKGGSVVDSYQTVSVNCNKCGQKLFRYKKKNGTKSNLVKCYVERISEDCAGVLEAAQVLTDGSDSAITLQPDYSWDCPSCNTQFARSATIHGRPALKMVGGKIRMTKK